MIKLKKILPIIFSLFCLCGNNAHSQIKSNYIEAQREIQKEISLIPKYSPDDFPSIKEKIAISRKVTDNDLINQSIPDDVEKKEILKYARAFRDRSNEIANVQKKYSNDTRFRYVKDILRKEYELTLENANNGYKLLTEGVNNGSSFSEINNNDKLNDDVIAQKRVELVAFRDGLFSSFANVENNYLEFNNCITQIAKKDDENYRGYPEIIFIKLKNDDSCRKYKSTITSAKTINDFLGEGSALSIVSKESENYRYDVEFSCSFTSVFGGLIIRKQGQVQVPDCVQGLGQFVHNYNNLDGYYKRKQEEKNENEIARKATEEKRIKAEEEEKIKKMLQDKNLELVYRRGSFVIGKNQKQQFVYIKDEVVKNKSDVKDEINLYEQSLLLQQQMERELKNLRAKNLAYRWVVQAQPVCPSGHQCWIKNISEVGRNDDGSVRFSIAYERRHGTAGSSGSATIVCGFNNPNQIKHTSVNAVCQ